MVVCGGCTIILSLIKGWGLEDVQKKKKKKASLSPGSCRQRNG